MCTVLIVATVLGGSPRTRGLARYLPDLGWEPILLTPSAPPDLTRRFRTIETPYPSPLASIRRLAGLSDGGSVREELKSRLGIASRRSLFDWLLTRAGAIVNYPDADRRWKRIALKKAGQFMEAAKPSAILSSSAPVTSHLIGRELKRRYQVPWVADLPDLWSDNNNYSYGAVRRLLDWRLERRTLREADALVTVSEPWRARLAARYAGRQVFCITNGFDPRFEGEADACRPTKFTITYTGMIYPRWQKPERLFCALRDLIREGKIDPTRIDVRFYGTEQPWLDEEIAAAGLGEVVRQVGRVAYEEALARQRESHVLLLLNWEDDRERGCYPLKTFEYLGARRPVLAIGGSEEDVVTRILNETKAGRSCADAKAIKDYVYELYEEYRNAGSVTYSGIEKEVCKYSYREMAGRFVEVLWRAMGLSAT